MTRISTGVTGLDEILEGGFLTNKIILVRGSLLALEGGHLGEVHVIIDHKKAKAKRDKLARKHDLVGKSIRKVIAKNARIVARAI